MATAATTSSPTWRGWQCGGARDAFCGPSGCPVTVWLSEPGGYARFELGRLQGFEIREAEPLPALVARYSAAFCGDASPMAAPGPGLRQQCPGGAAGRDAAAEPGGGGSRPPSRRRRPAATRGARRAGRCATCRGRARWRSAWAPATSPPWLRSAWRGSLPGADLSPSARGGQRPARLRVQPGRGRCLGRLRGDGGRRLVVALADESLAARLGGRDTEVAVSVDGHAEGTLSLAGSTKALRGALADCHGVLIRAV